MIGRITVAACILVMCSCYVPPRVDPTPRLVWTAFAPNPGPSTDGTVTGPTYELRVWRLVDGAADCVVYERTGLTETTHHVTEPLEREHYEYAWSGARATS